MASKSLFGFLIIATTLIAFSIASRYHSNRAPTPRNCDKCGFGCCKWNSCEPRIEGAPCTSANPGDGQERCINGTCVVIPPECGGNCSRGCCTTGSSCIPVADGSPCTHSLDYDSRCFGGRCIYPEDVPLCGSLCDEGIGFWSNPQTANGCCVGSCGFKPDGTNCISGVSTVSAQEVCYKGRCIDPSDTNYRLCQPYCLD